MKGIHTIVRAAFIMGICLPALLWSIAYYPVAAEEVPSRYTITRIGLLPRCNYTRPQAINNTGWVIGYSAISGTDTPGLPFSFVWFEGELYPQKTLNGDYSYAYGMNDRGDVVGQSDRITRYGYGLIEEKWERLPVVWPGY